ncbi:MAG TPA: alpha-glucan family phosphorylase, partial [Aggregatilineales bacterium]|nr:alpha-glucan family phosphorylase [Aggregatilineales bacterium]
MIRPVTTFTVTPNLPPRLERLKDLAYNLRWSWDHETIALFRRLDNELWIETGANPVQLLGMVSQKRLNEAIDDPSFMSQLERAWEHFTSYMEDTSTWYRTHYGDHSQPYIAYFSMEFGITTCLKNYSGGLGVLSGDHMKSASDLDLPLVGVGLLYQEGYFRQYLSANGYQQESYPINDYSNMPVSPARLEDGKRLEITVPIAQFNLKAWVWKVQVGRAALYLMDANHSDNPDELRNLTDRLYGGDRRLRIRQEILLGIGGIRMLDA